MQSLLILVSSVDCSTSAITVERMLSSTKRTTPDETANSSTAGLTSKTVVTAVSLTVTLLAFEVARRGSV